MISRRNQMRLYAALQATGAEYVVVGGMAVNAHGYSRNTNDLDLFCRPTLANAQAAPSICWTWNGSS